MTHWIAQLQETLGSDAVELDPLRRERASRDYYWMSPILKAQLGELPPAEAVVKPGSVEEVSAALQIAYIHGIPVTPRGKGTGNYGQSVPCFAGMVIDLQRLNRIEAIDPDWITADAGCHFRQLETAAHTTEQELQLVPSTTLSTLGGFLSGGNGGAGSVEYGSIWDDFVEWLEIVPCTAEATPFRVSGKDCHRYMHTFGATGLIVRARIRLRPKRNWTALFFSFPADGLKAVAAASLEIVNLPIPSRLNSFDLPDTVANFSEDAAVPKGRISLRPMVDRSVVPAVREIVERHGGRFEADRPESLEQLHQHSFNHPTLWTLRKRPDFCHLQVKGETLIEHAEAILALLPEATFHFDSRREGGIDCFGGILLSRFVDEATMDRAIEAIRAMGLHVLNVHSHFLGGGHPPSIETILAVRETTDPKGLLNTGRLPSTATA